MLGELADGGLDLTAATQGPSAAHGIDVDAEGSRRIEQRGAGCEAPASARWREDDERIVVRHGADDPGDVRVPLPPLPGARHDTS